MADTVFTHIIRYVQEAIGGPAVRTELQKTDAQTEKTIRSILGLTQTTEQAGTAGKTAAPKIGDFEKAIRRAAIVAPVWMLLRTAMMSTFKLIQDQTKFIIDLETSMARIRIVGKGTSEEFSNLRDSLVALSYAYGVTATEAVDAAKIFAQQGKTVSETLYLTQQAMLAAQVLGEDVKTTVDNLTAALKGFNIPMSQSVGIIDKWVGVEKEFAVTARDLADATKAAGSTANQMGITISQFLGDVTSVIEVTRKSGSEAARGLSFIYARLLTSARPVVEATAQIAFYLDKQGQATNALTGVLRPASDILGDLAVKWNTLTREERLEIAASVASKRQMTVFNALMQNYNQSLNARIKALSSAGQAERAFGLIQDTTAFKLKQVSSAWNNMTIAVGDTSVFKGAIDSFKDFLNNITMIISIEKGFRASMAETVTAQKIAAETQFTMASNFKEVIALRDKLLQAPATDETTQRIKILNDAIDESVKKEPSFKLALDAPTSEEFDKVIEDIKKSALRKKVILDVSLEYDPKIIEQQTKVDRPILLPGERAKAEQEIINLQKKKTSEIEKQYRLALADYELKKGLTDTTEEEVDAITELTDKDKELLDIERKIIILKGQRIIDADTLIAKEIELIKQSKYSYTEYEKAKKIEELQNSLLTERLKIREEERDLLIDQALEIAKIKGASSAQLVLAEAALKAATGSQKQIEVLKQRLEMEKLITKEKLNQVEVGDETLTLYKVAKERGIEIARQIGKFLTGQLDFGRIKNMPDVLSAFKEYFSARYEQLQAAEYLGIPFRGQGRLGGERRTGREGSSIPIPEFQAIEQIPSAIAQISKPTTISGLNVTVNAEIKSEDTKEVKAKKIVIDIAEAIRTNPAVQDAIKEQIEDF